MRKFMETHGQILLHLQSHVSPPIARTVPKISFLLPNISKLLQKTTIQKVKHSSENPVSMLDSS